MFSRKMNYHDYLQIDKLLGAQKLESQIQGKPAHDEMLFIIIHQVYELWFKQILTEVGSVLDIFSGGHSKDFDRSSACYGNPDAAGFFRVSRFADPRLGISEPTVSPA